MSFDLVHGEVRSKLAVGLAVKIVEFCWPLLGQRCCRITIMEASLVTLHKQRRIREEKICAVPEAKKTSK